MNDNLCIFGRLAKAGLGFFFLITAIAFTISGFTVFPFFGFIFAVPVLLLSLYFFTAHLDNTCRLE